MPALNLFLPPLLGGFIFVSFFYVSRLWVEREQGYKLVFAASIVGGLAWALSILLWQYLYRWTWATNVQTWFAETFSEPQLLASATAFLVCAISWLPLNLLSRLPGRGHSES